MRTKLKLGDKVVAKFLGSPYNCTVIEIIDKETYKLKTAQGTILPSVKWEKKAPRDKKGNITTPWYIIKTGTKTIKHDKED